MPITVTRPNLEAQLDRADEEKLQRVAAASVEYLATYEEYGFTGAELAARIDESAAPVVVEHALSSTDDHDVDYTILNEKLYWYVPSS